MSFVLRTLLTKCPSYFTWNRSKMMNRILLRFSKQMSVKCPVNMLSSATCIQNEENHVLDWAVWKPTISICSLQTFLQWLFRRILRKFPYISAYMSRTPFTALTGICRVKKAGVGTLMVTTGALHVLQLQLSAPVVRWAIPPELLLASRLYPTFRVLKYGD